MEDYIISAEDLQSGLRGLREECKVLNPLVYIFAEYIAGTIKSEKNQFGFGQSIENAISILSENLDPKIDSETARLLVKQEPQIYSSLRSMLMDYLDWVLPDKFVEGVDEYFIRLNDAKKKPSMEYNI